MKRIVHHPEAGAALVTAVVSCFTVLLLSLTYSFTSVQNYECSTREIEFVRASLASENGLHRSMAELRIGTDADADGLGTLSFTDSDGAAVSVVATPLGGEVWRLVSTARHPRATYAGDALVRLQPATPLTYGLRAAITARGDVSLSGNITVDGRNWNSSGTSVVGAGTYGVSSQQNIAAGGSGSVGGNGAAPANPPPAAAIEPEALWHNGIDDDGDGSTDEEDYNGLDDDGDGEVDEDINDFPEGPDAALGLAPGTLQSIAEANGTYFATQTALDAYLLAHGGEMPGGIILYVDFPVWQPAAFGNAMNVQPSIVVHHNSTGTALMKNLHGVLKGLILADCVEHINGDFLLLGGLMSFANEAYGNTFGNGSAQVLYSEESLMSLPPVSASRRIRMISWNRTGVPVGEGGPAPAPVPLPVPSPSPLPTPSPIPLSLP